MEPPRLKINEHEVGLRKIGDNLFEPKNKSVLLKTLLDRLVLQLVLQHSRYPCRMLSAYRLHIVVVAPLAHLGCSQVGD